MIEEKEEMPGKQNNEDEFSVGNEGQMYSAVSHSKNASYVDYAYEVESYEEEINTEPGKPLLTKQCL